MRNESPSFQHVKNLLGKLDRSIDEARTKRLGDDDAPETPPSSERVDLDRAIGSRAVDAEETVERAAPPEAAPSPAEQAGPRPVPSKYGRAKPLRRPDTMGQQVGWS